MNGAEVLFICTANQCRSPMAEYLFADHFCGDGRRCCSSAGVLAAPGVPASRNAIKVMKELGIDLRPHRSSMLTRERLDAAGVVAVMTGMHRMLLLERFPDAADRVFLLGTFAEGSNGREIEIEDPVGLSLEVYRLVRDQIAAALWGLDAFLGQQDAEKGIHIRE